MAETDWLNPNSVVQTSGGDRVWDTPEYAAAEDAAYSNVDIAASETTTRLYASDFNTVATVPGTATINGISVRVIRHAVDVASGGKAKDLMMQLVDATGNAFGNDKSDANNWSDTDEEITYGGGGAYSKKTISVTPSTVYNLFVGDGGAGGTP